MLKVPVVDGEAFVRSGIVLETDWTSLGYTVVMEAENDLEGIKAVYKYNPNIVISDIRMPKMDGVSMFRTLRKEGNKVEVIFLTIYNEFEYAQDALQLLVVNYLLKPSEDEELEVAIDKVREKLKREQGENRRQDEGKTLSLNLEPGDKSKYTMKAIAYTSSHYSESNINVGTIAESLGVSEDCLSHLFRKKTNCTIMSYITRHRIRAAVKLLNNCCYKIHEVMEVVGCRDVTYFSGTFKETAGVSPSEYQGQSATDPGQED